MTSSLLLRILCCSLLMTGCHWTQRSAIVCPTSNQVRFLPSPDEHEIYDFKQGIAWRRCVEGMTWKQGSCQGQAREFSYAMAIEYTQQQVQRGKDWRIPSVEELEILADKTRADPAIDPIMFPQTPNKWFWSRSPYIPVPSHGWTVSFLSGSVSNISRYRGLLVLRLVRTLNQEPSIMLPKEVLDDKSSRRY